MLTSRLRPLKHAAVPRSDSSAEPRPNLLLVTTLLSVVSGIIGVVAGQGLEFLKTRELRREEQRARVEERIWTETQQIYRKFFAMRTRLPTEIVNYRFAVIEKHYFEARARMAPRDRQIAMLLQSRRQAAVTARVAFLNTRAELQELLAWVDLMAPPKSSEEWRKTVQALAVLARWEITEPPGNLPELERWRLREERRASDECRAEIPAKVEAVLALIRNEHQNLLTDVGVHKP